jgi:DNA-directed RNA polymerase subunit K
MNINDFTRYEKARILGARAFQIAMNAPLLIKITQEDLEKIKFDALKIAEVELNSNILPISVKKPFPKKKEEKLKRIKTPKVSDNKIEKEEQVEEGEIMELATPDDEEESEQEKGEE